MRYTIAALALAGSALASPAPQGVTSAIAPSSSPPAGCSESHSGTFQITIVNVTSTPAKRDLGDLEKVSTRLVTRLGTRRARIEAHNYYSVRSRVSSP